MIEQVRTLWEHGHWADTRIAHALQGGGEESLTDALREFSHVLGTAETWLARLERRPAALAIWPDIGVPGLEPLVAQVHGRYTDYLARLTETGLQGTASYTNSAGDGFENRVWDILLHAAMHGQYHRGKVNLLLRQSGREPAPVDYIGFIRGVPAAITRP